MASYPHGVVTSESPTSLIPPVQVLSAVPFVVGIAPVNTLSEYTVNKPVLCYSYAEAVANFGFEAAVQEGNIFKFRYNLSEFIYSTFNFYNITPIVLVNVLDPAKHKKTAETVTVTFDPKTGQAVITEKGIIASSIVLKEQELLDDYVQGEDYVVAFDDDGQCVLSSLKEGDAFNVVTDVALQISADVIDPSAVTTDDIIGGIGLDGNKKGLELLSEVYPRFGIIPTLVLSPWYSHDPEVAAVMAAKTLGINTVFNAMAIADIDCETCTKYTDVSAWKNDNGYNDANLIACWPRLEMSGTIYAMSTHLAGLFGKVDGDNDGVPYVSPSNKAFSMTGLALDDGIEVVLGLEEANYLNGQGIVTALNFSGGWKCWGNRTSIYPGSTDPKDAFIPVKRMFYFIANSLVTTYWQKVDDAMNKRLIDTVIDSVQVWLNSFVAAQQLLAASILFRQEDNPTTSLMDGKLSFKLYMTPPSPAEQIAFDLEIDVSAYETLFS